MIIFFFLFLVFSPKEKSLAQATWQSQTMLQTRQNFSGPLFQDDGQGGITESRLPPTGNLQEEVSSADGGVIGAKGMGGSVWTVYYQDN